MVNSRSVSTIILGYNKLFWSPHIMVCPPSEPAISLATCRSYTAESPCLIHAPGGTACSRTVLKVCRASMSGGVCLAYCAIAWRESLRSDQLCALHRRTSSFHQKSVSAPVSSCLEWSSPAPQECQVSHVGMSRLSVHPSVVFAV